MPFICKCQKIYNDKTFKFELLFSIIGSRGMLWVAEQRSRK